jgi:hypothetical protein
LRIQSIRANSPLGCEAAFVVFFIRILVTGMRDEESVKASLLTREADLFSIGE